MDIDEILTIICQIKSNKATGPNSIPTSILHQVRDIISKPLCNLINLSLSSGTHPELLKIANAIPVFKKGSRLSLSNYRPISLLSNINKIFEKVIFERVYKYLEIYNLLYEKQFGFRKKHSTNHALISITEQIREALDNKKVATGIFVDFQKAFDTVNHNILLSKLDHYGIRGNVNNWFKSYLIGRKQYVSINGFKSKESTINHGVPQGSVLGPLLFLVYINDLHLCIQNSITYHFADDTNFLCIGKSLKKIQKKVNSDLKKLVSWLLANKISLNKTKTELIIFRKPRDPIPIEHKFKLNGLKLTVSRYIKYLGVYLDDTLSGQYHCALLINKLARSNAMLSKARHFVPIDKLISIYFAIFSSHMTYGCQIWGLNKSSLHFKKIERLQKKAVRIMSFSRHDAPSEPIFRKFNILKLKDQITLFNCLFIHDQTHNLLPSNFNDFFLPCSDLYDTDTRRRAGCLFTPQYSSNTYGRQSVKVSAILAWNNLCETLDMDLLSLKKTTLKKTIHNHFINSYSDS